MNDNDLVLIDTSRYMENGKKGFYVDRLSYERMCKVLGNIKSFHPYLPPEFINNDYNRLGMKNFDEIFDFENVYVCIKIMED